jgi:hypothetical protein
MSTAAHLQFGQRSIVLLTIPLLFNSEIDKQPSFDYDQNEDSFNMMICSIITHYQMPNLI